jgi:hypothetical protein
LAAHCNQLPAGFAAALVKFLVKHEVKFFFFLKKKTDFFYAEFYLLTEKEEAERKFSVLCQKQNLCNPGGTL